MEKVVSLPLRWGRIFVESHAFTGAFDIMIR